MSGRSTSTVALRFPHTVARVQHHDHALRYAPTGIIECRHCGAVLAESDAEAFDARRATVWILGDFIRPCPGIVTTLGLLHGPRVYSGRDCGCGWGDLCDAPPHGICGASRPVKTAA